MSYLAIENISKSYGDIKALDGFSLTIQRGEIFALVGPDGAGKTSLIRILCRLTDPDEGRVLLDGRSMLHDFDRMKPLIGYMPQQFSLYPDLSVAENLIFYAGIYGMTGAPYRQKRDRLYEFSNLGPFSKRRAGALSGGMKQKLALSCALMHDPELLILDEPTTGVDPLSRRQFWEILLALRSQGVTILITTPYMDEVARANHACFIFGGHKLGEGSPDTLAHGFEGKVYRFDSKLTLDQIRSIDSVEGMSARRFGTGTHLYVTSGDALKHHNSLFRRSGIDPGSLVPVAPTLEDRFIQLMESQP